MGKLSTNDTRGWSADACSSFYITSTCHRAHRKSCHFASRKWKPRGNRRTAQFMQSTQLCDSLPKTQSACNANGSNLLTLRKAGVVTRSLTCKPCGAFNAPNSRPTCSRPSRAEKVKSRAFPMGMSTTAHGNADGSALVTSTIRSVNLADGTSAPERLSLPQRSSWSQAE